MSGAVTAAQLLTRISFTLVSFTLTLLTAGTAAAQTGVSDDRVSLPEGPGSLEGVGENVAVNPNMGLMSQEVSVLLPEGYPGMTPSLGLSYSSGAGNGVPGMGWSMPFPAIERLTRRGLPLYTPSDEMSVGGGEELVRIPDTDPPVYRARFEGGFVRYLWMDADDGRTGYWVAEYPDGKRGFFGADRDGNLVADAHLSGDAGTFRWHLVDMVDTWDHVIRYSYAKYGNYTYPVQVGWVHQDGEPHFTATLTYEERLDRISDCKAGFPELMAYRLDEVQVRSGGELLRRYRMEYEPYETSGKLSRLVAVTRFGKDGGQYPVRGTFQYTSGIGNQTPYVQTMGSPLGIDIASGNTTLIDINGDGLSDIVDTSDPGAPHRFWLNVPDATLGTSGFDGPYSSAVGAQGTYDLSSTAVQVLDVDGDGFTDMLNAQLGKALRNLGNGDWEAEPLSLWEQGEANLPGEFQPTEGELQLVRFMDYDGDKRIDVIRSEFSGDDNITQIYRNSGGSNFVADESVSPIGEGFGTGSLELNDMNGDGLLDPVQVLTSMVRFKLNLGWGTWSEEWVEIGGFDFSSQEAIDAELEDLNGDALADLVIVSGNTVRYWLNRNGEGFDAEQVVTSALVDGELPAKEDTAVLYADMNGNGSSDVVWMSNTGLVTFLELFPERPNLLVRIENGLGKTTDIVYESSVQQLAAAPEGWKYRLPFPMTVVKQITESDALTQLPQVSTWTYHDGFYHGDEKDFRGYERVEEVMSGDSSQEPGMTRQTFDLGADDSWRKGKPLTAESWSAGELLQSTTMTWDDCAVADVPSPGDPDLAWDVRFVCQTSLEETYVERAEASEWIVTRDTYAYDGYGNMVLEVANGIVSIGGGGCGACVSDTLRSAPCGASCLGDELYTETEFFEPAAGDRYMVRTPIRRVVYGQADANGGPATNSYRENIWYYDGDAFVGLPFGQVDRGFVSRSTSRRDTSGAVIVDRRAQSDTHGNMVAEKAVGQPDASLDGFRTWEFEPLGLMPTVTTIHQEDEQGPYQLVRNLEFDPFWREVTALDYLQVYRDGAPQGTTAGTQVFQFDEHGQLSSHAVAGTTAEAPSATFEYAYGNPVSRLVTRRRAVANGPFEAESITCTDGRGREVQKKALVAPGVYQANGFTLYNVRGEVYQAWGPYVSSNADCDLTPPDDEPDTYFYDAKGRPLEHIEPAEEGDAAPVRRVVEHGPMVLRTWDAEDLNDAGPYYGTPTSAWSNGLGMVTHIEHTLDPGGDPVVYRVLYDEFNQFAGLIAPDGLARWHDMNLLGERLAVHSPDRGTVLYEYDDAGNVVKETDPTGNVLRRRYDGLERVLERWEESSADTHRITFRYDTPAAGCDPEDCAHLAGHLSATTWSLGDGTTGEEHLGYNVRREANFNRKTIDGISFVSRSEMDLLGRFTRDTLPSGLVVNRTYDAAARITAVENIIDLVSYHDNGQVAAIDFSNGTRQEWAFDERDQLSAIDLTGPGGSLLALSFARNLVGHLTAIEDASPDNGLPSSAATFHYDNLYRVIEADLDPDRPEHREILSYSYDTVGRILSKESDLGAASPAHVGSYVYGEGGAGPNAVTTAGALTLAYDATGRMTNRDGTSYTWDPWGRLQSAHRDGETVAHFAYGAGPDRVRKKEGHSTTYYVSQSFEVRDGVATTFVQLGRDRLARVSEPAFAAAVLGDLAPASGPTTALVSEPDGEMSAGDGWLAQAVAIGAVQLEKPLATSPEAMLDAANRRLLDGLSQSTTWLHPDHKGSTTLVTDEAGAVVNQTRYYPYGQVRHTVDDEESVGYSSKERDRSTGLVYYGHRYLDPLTARWASPDPAFDILDEDAVTRHMEGVVGYGVELGDPINQRDEDGRFVVTAVVLGVSVTASVVGGIAGAVVGVVSEIIRQKAYPERGSLKSRIGWVLYAGAMGGTFGALSFGTSVIGDLTSAAVVHLYAKYNGKKGQVAVERSYVAGQAAGLVLRVSSDLASGNPITAAVTLAGGALWVGVSALSYKLTNRSIAANAGLVVGKIGGAIMGTSVGRGIKHFGSRIFPKERLSAALTLQKQRWAARKARLGAKMRKLVQRVSRSQAAKAAPRAPSRGVSGSIKIVGQ